MDQPGHTVKAKGKVTKKRVDGNDHVVECDIWLENDKGEKTTPGSATVILPSRRRVSPALSNNPGADGVKLALSTLRGHFRCAWRAV